MAAPAILLVEDDPEQAMLFSRVLALSGYTVETVATADQALAQLAVSAYALLLADWDLPGMNGDALITAAQQVDPRMKTVLYSNHVNVEEAAAAVGADAAFRKIEGITRLRSLVHALVPPAA